MADLENKDLETQEVETETSEENNNKPDINQLLTELAELKAMNAKQKNALDKALKNNGDLTKQLRAKMTAEEVETEEKQKAKAEHDEYVKGLERRIAHGEATERYLGLGMSQEMARQTAQFELDGDKTAVSESLVKFMQARDKAKEAEWIKSRPPVNVGGDDDASEDAFLAGIRSVKQF